jgi:tetratricopeptide (TPR) repeat protein
LDAIDLNNTQFINKFQYFSIQARTFQKLEILDRALESYKIALDVPQEDNSAIQKQRAQLFYELGSVFYQQTIQKIKDRENDSITTVLDNAINAFNSAIQIWLTLGDYPNLIAVETLTANIYTYEQQYSQAEIHYRQASEYAEKINDFAGFIKLSHELIQNEFFQAKFDFIIQDLLHILQIIQQNAFVDAITVGIFHRQLALAYQKLDDEQSALDELIITTNIYNRLAAPITEQLEVLEAIATIYKHRGEDEKADYYREQREIQSRRIETQPVTQSKVYHLGDIKEVWIYYNTGIEMFSFAPETSVNPDLFGGFLSAMQAFTIEVSKNELNAIIMGEDRYSFYREKDWNFFILGRSSIKASEVIVEKILRKIHQKFRELYEPYILNFEGEISAFKSFRNELESMDFTLLDV